MIVTDGNGHVINSNVSDRVWIIADRASLLHDKQIRLAGFICGANVCMGDTTWCQFLS
jgi:hypothetical protein